MSKKLIAEVIGTFILVFFGTCAIVYMGTDIGKLGIGMAFGLGVVAAAYGIGSISGAHLNPAVSIGMVTAGRMPVGDFIGYVVAQVIGAILAIIVIKIMGTPDGGLGATTVGATGTTAAFIFEAVATFLFVRDPWRNRLERRRRGTCRSRHRPDAGCDPPCRHQRLRLIGQSGPFARPGDLPWRRRAGTDVALHHRPARGRRRCWRAARGWHHPRWLTST